MIEDKELHQLFKAESEEHLAHLDDGLLRLEKTPADQPLLEEVFRASHSLKGAARMLGLAKIETGAHGLETLLNTARKGEGPLTPSVIERMNRVLATLRKLAHEALTGEAAGVSNADLLAQLQGAPTTGPASAPTSRKQETALPAETTPSSLPATTQPIPDQPISPEQTVPLFSSAKIPEVAEVAETIRPAGEEFHIETVRVETRQLDDLLTLVGELSVIEGRMQHRLALMDGLLEQWSLLERSRRKVQTLLRRWATDDTHEEVSVRSSEWQLLQATLTTQAADCEPFGSQLQEIRDAFYEDGARLEMTAATLEDQVHGARLLPLSTVFSLFPRMVRDLAKEQDKEVELVMEGGEINVDKRILEEMKDPLMHLLRNAIDHGMEPPAKREQQGKPRCGTLLLQALRENSRVRLEVRDDGCGLDVEAIRQTALKRGLHDEATLAAMPIPQVQQLIFLPGFSTATFVTELSGRGVGLDVVRVNVERLKGDIRMQSVPGQGTTMQMHLPLSLATTRLLQARVGDRLYGLPIESIYASQHVTEEDIFSLEGYPAMEVDGQPIIAPCLADLLGLPGENRGDETVCIIIQVGDELLGLRVDELVGEEEVVTKPLAAPLQRVRNIAGLTILGSGEISALLNPADLLRSIHKFAAVPVRDQGTGAGATTKGAILLVEDSALVRAMEKRILEDGGYEVVTAVDGVDGLNALGQRAFAAVVSDIVMPNMDGLTLTARIREQPRYQDLPVILVTTLSSDDDKRRGLEVGANAYIPKPSFDQRVLLETLQRLI
ncbi:MAG: hybrid sensor histidine kinase/response regulator [Desulfobulbaceae bacterium]|nr:hybrid sensor histidine kinase/response regulator [Desulfobulbaceae bacterium]